MLDDFHFVAAGMNTEKLDGYYTTEEEGCNLHVFHISKNMRYLIPFANVEETIEYFKTLIAENHGCNPVVVMADDSENLVCDQALISRKVEKYVDSGNHHFEKILNSLYAESV